MCALPGHQQLLVSMTASDIRIMSSHPVIPLASTAIYGPICSRSQKVMNAPPC